MSQKINFRIRGQGHPLILLHGFAGSVLHWEEVAGNLEKKFRVVPVNYSHFYLGRTHVSFSQQVRRLKVFIEENFKEEKVHLAGISYGAALCWALAAQYPEFIDRVVFINPMPVVPEKSFAMPLVRYFFKIPMHIKAIYFFLQTPLGRNFLKRSAEIFRVERAEGEARIENLKGRKLLLVANLYYQFMWILKNERWTDWESLVEKNPPRSMLMYDRFDPLFSERAYVEFAETMKCERVVYVESAGHIAIRTKPEFIAEQIQKYLSASNH